MMETKPLFFGKGLKRLRSWYQRVTNKSWIGVPEHRVIYITSAVLICLALFTSAHMRVWQYNQWSNAQDIYYVEGFPAFSTTDAAYFLLKAQEIKTHGNSERLKRKRNYPDFFEMEPTSTSSVRDEPLLAVLISLLSPDASIRSLSIAAHRMLPVSVTLTALAVILAFGAARLWTEGAIAALGSSLSGAFLERTSAGRLDTDQLNLGFFYLITALIIWSSRAKNIFLALFFCSAAAAVTHLFNWWWPKPVLNWVFLFGIVSLAYFLNRSFSRSVFLGAAYLTMISSLNFGISVNFDDYATSINLVDKLKLPNTFDAVTELEVISVNDMLKLLMGNIWIASFAIVGIVGWVCIMPVYALVFLPAIIVAAMNIVFGNRVVFFAAPIFWFGFAWLVLTSGRYSLERLMAVSARRPSTGFAFAQSCLAAVIFATTFLISFNPMSKPYVPNTVFNREVVEGFRFLGDYVRESGRDRTAVIATWWDYGYTASLFSQLPTLIDGGTQRGAKTHLLARALTSSDQSESAQILKYISNDGTTGILKNSASNAALAKAFSQGPKQNRSDVYLVLTSKMSLWMPTITSLGLWNSETGTPLPVHRETNRLEYIDLACTGDDSLISCSGKRINLQNGTVDGRAVLSGTIQTDNGISVARVDYPNPNGFYIQFNQLDGKTWANQLLHPKLYHSTFNKLFYLGDFNPYYFTEVINAYPQYRVYRIN